MREFNPRSVPAPRISGSELAALKNRSLDLEIGAGQGLHAIQYCQANPNRTLAAIERTQNRFHQLKTRSNRHPDVRNLVPIRADAIAFVTHFMDDESIERVFLYYPNPYPKARQANLRWHRSPFLGFLHRKMKRGSTLHLATNLAWYATEAESYLNESKLFRLRQKTKLDNSFRPRTHFEAKYLARGETCFDLVFEKELQ